MVRSRKNGTMFKNRRGAPNAAIKAGTTIIDIPKKQNGRPVLSKICRR
jgi:hypothetical protein